MSNAISVVVPTRDRPESLARCLASVAEADSAGLDVVVVDDGSRDRGAVRDAASVIAGARVVRGPGRGPAAARNLGVRAARGEIVCFIDDDCVAAPGWARTLATAVVAGPDRQGLAAAAGGTRAPLGAPASVAASQAIVEYVTLASLDQVCGRVGFAPTSNLAATREALLKLPFDESYPSAAGEDRDWCARAAREGVAIAWEPGATVVHHQELEGVRGFMRQQYRYGRGAARFRRGGADRQLAGAGFYAGLVRRGFEEGAAVGALVAAAQMATAAGAVAERVSGLGREGG